MFSVSDEAKEVLSAIDGPLSIIAVVGQYRTGKSFLLNRILLGRNDGFAVGSTVNACTKGLWIWSEPLRAIAADGTAVNLLIIDTEGLNSMEAGTKHDCIIFALALLTSSFFLYNSVGTISESAIDTVVCVCVRVSRQQHLRAHACSAGLCWVVGYPELRENGGRHVS
jgi:hypothetical protein